MKNRSKLNRAGVLKAYQSGDETIDLAGGRLLLRGVNGSGKSTAMNVPLPFLIEADVPRIDAAGEQAGMLRSWMLSGREEPNPVGYLWIEFERLDAGTGESHLACGCGIRASSSTDRVTTRWFVPNRRPGIDSSFLDRRTPLTVDSLRTILGHLQCSTTIDAATTAAKSDPYSLVVLIWISTSASCTLCEVLGSETASLWISRNTWRVPSRDCRKPRSPTPPNHSKISMSIATTWPRCVELQTRLLASARSTKAMHALSCEPERRKPKCRPCTGDGALSSAEDVVSRLEDQDTRIDTELQALRQRPADSDGQSLMDLRNHVASLATAKQTAQDDAQQFERRRVEAARGVVDGHRAFTSAVASLRSHLGDAAALAAPWRVELPMVLPSVSVSSASEPEVGDLALPASTSIEHPALLSAFTRTITEAELRRFDIADVVAMLDAVDRLERALHAAEERRVELMAHASVRLGCRLCVNW